MSRHRYKKNKKNKLVAAVLLSCLLGNNTALGANLVAVVPSDFKNSQVGTLSGSRVTAYIDPASATMKIDELGRDPSVFNINYNGISQVILRQYNYSTTDLKAVNIINPKNVNWTDYVSSGVLSSVANMHAAATYGDYLYTTDYDLGSLAVSNLCKSTLSESEHHSLKKDIVDITGSEYAEKVTVHGEGLVVKDKYLYAITSVNLDGGYDNYDDGYLLQYVINDDGSLVAIDAQRIGKNTFNMHSFNDTLFTCSTGGYQQMGFPNKETAIHAVNVNNGSLRSSRKISIPDGVQGEFRDMTITNDGTAYVFGGYYDKSYGGIIGNIYKTTVTNLLADKPIAWEKVIEINDWPGFNWDIEVESNPRRLWFLAGNKLKIYQDGSSTPLEFDASDFATKEGLNQFNSWGFAFITPDTVVNGNSKTVQLKVGEGLTSPSATISKTIILPVQDTSSNGTNAISGTPDYTTRIMGLQQYNNGTGIEYKDTEYQKKGVTTDFENYKFTQDTTIGLTASAEGDYKTNILAAVFARYGQDITVDSGSHTLTLNVANNAGNPTGIYVGNGRNVTLNAGQLNINTATYDDGEMVTNAIWNDAAKDTASSITINAPVHITMAGGQGGNGIAITKKDRWGESSAEATAKSTITINGDVTITGTDGSWGVPLNSKNVYSRFNSAGLYTSINNSEINVNGNVDMAIYGNGISTVADGSKITVGGGTIQVPVGKKYGYYSLASYLGTINMNTGTDGQTVGNNTVKLTGDLFTLKTGAINLALTDSNSYLKGIIDNGGTANLHLKNGATWYNEQQNTRYAEDNEDVGAGGVSHVTKLAGGSSEGSRGVIYQKDTNPLTIDKYSGHTLVWYDHNTAAPAIINGGTITVKSAAADSAITLWTGNNGVNTAETATAAEKTTVNTVLDKLAQKLTYSGYIGKAENNLKGYVGIAEGLTSASALKSGEIKFSETDGKGSYEAPKPVETGNSIKESITLTSAKTVNAVDTDAITGGMVAAAYNIAAEPVNIIAGANDLTLNAASSAEKNNQTAGIYAHNKTVNISGSKTVVITATSGGNAAAAGIYADDGATVKAGAPVKITASTQGTTAYGVKANKNSSVTIDGTVTINNNDFTALQAQAGTTESNKYDGIAGLYVGGQNGNITVNDAVDIKVNGTGAAVNGDNGVITLKGGSIAVNSNNDYTYRVLSAANGTINMNTDGSAVVKLDGNTYTDAGGTINLALGSGSYWKGVADSGAAGDIGTFNLTLQNGAQWTNANQSKVSATFTGSHVTKLAGGSSEGSRGVIYQKDTNPLTIDKYSGHTLVWYDHNTAAPATINGGTITVKSAAADSAITLWTGNNGVNTAETATAAEKTTVNTVLDKLAQKLTYSGYIGKAENNLKGYVGIAEGLTSASALKSGEIKFSETDGKGSYEGGVVPPTPPVIPDEFTTAITGSAADTEYKDVVDATYKTYTFSKGTAITVDDADAVVNGVTAAVYGAKDKEIAIAAAGNALKLNVNAVNNTAYGLAAAAAGSNINVTADSVLITTAGSANSSGIYANGGNVTVSKNVSINAGQGDGIKIINNGTVNIGGNVDITAAKGKGISIGNSTSNKLLRAANEVPNALNIGGNLTVKNAAEAIEVVGADKSLAVTGDTDITVSGNTAVKVDGGTVKLTGAAKIAAAGKTTLMTENHGNIIIGGIDKDVDIIGNIQNDSGNIELTMGAGSTLEGGVTTANGATTKLTLNNGAKWSVDAGNNAQVTELVGGSKGKSGVIEQKSVNAITVGTLSGNVDVKYASTYANGKLTINEGLGKFVVDGLKGGSTDNSVTVCAPSEGCVI